MEGWVDLGSLIAAQPGIKPTTAWSHVRCPNRYANKPATIYHSILKYHLYDDHGHMRWSIRFRSDLCPYPAICFCFLLHCKDVLNVYLVWEVVGNILQWGKPTTIILQHPACKSTVTTAECVCVCMFVGGKPRQEITLWDNPVVVSVLSQSRRIFTVWVFPSFWTDVSWREWGCFCKETEWPLVCKTWKCQEI